MLTAWQPLSILKCTQWWYHKMILIRSRPLRYYEASVIVRKTSKKYPYSWNYFRNSSGHRDGWTSNNKELQKAADPDLWSGAVALNFQSQLWNQGNEESSLNVREPGQVKQYGLLSLPASQSAHTARDSWMSSFTLPAPALMAWFTT